MLMKIRIAMTDTPKAMHLYPRSRMFQSFVFDGSFFLTWKAAGNIPPESPFWQQERRDSTPIPLP
jgi:hypothetical protein